LAYTQVKFCHRYCPNINLEAIRKILFLKVATLSVFAYFFFSLFAAQYLIPHENSKDEVTFPLLEISFSTVDPFNKHTPNMIVPYFTILEFIGYMGWIKVTKLTFKTKI